MQNISSESKINHALSMTETDLNSLRLKTDKFVSSKGNLFKNKSAGRVNTSIPIELLVIPDYQEARAQESELDGSISKLLDNFNPNKMAAIIVNYRDGIFYINDGYHRARVGEKRNESDVDTKVIFVSYDEEVDLFASQDDTKKPVQFEIKYDAYLGMSPSAASKYNNCRYAHILDGLLYKYNVRQYIRERGDAMYIKENEANGKCCLALKTIWEMNLDDCKNNRDSVDWSLDILTKSGYAGRYEGLGSTILMGLKSINTNLHKGLYGTYSYQLSESIKDIIVRGLKTEYDISLFLSCADNAVKENQCKKDKRAKARFILDYWTRIELNCPIPASVVGNVRKVF